MSRQKTTAAHWVEYFLFRIFEGIFRLFSIESVFSIGEFVGRLGHRLTPHYRRIVRRNLRIAYAGDKTATEIEELVQAVFERNGANLFSSIRSVFLSDAEIRQRVHIEGLEHCRAAHEKNDGVVLIIPHMGNWELIAQAPELLGFPVKGGTFYRPFNNPLMNRLIEKRRQQRGVRLFPKKSSTHSMVNFLREGGFLGILADVRVGLRGEVYPFFDRLTTCSPLPRLLAQRSNAQIIGLTCLTIGRARWVLTFSPVEGTKTAACVTTMENAYRSAPEDVFWFQDRWKLTPRQSLKLPESEEEIPATTKNVRVLSLLSARDTDLFLPSRDGRRDLDIERAELSSHLDRQWLASINDREMLPLDLILCYEENLTQVKKIARPLQITVTIPAHLVNNA